MRWMCHWSISVLSTDMENRVTELLNDGWTEIEVAGVFGVSVRSLRRWKGNIAAKRKVNPRSVLRGYPRILDAAVMEDVRALAEDPLSGRNCRLSCHYPRYPYLNKCT
ncbi:hypothetical protein BDN67DRAFT_250621 [Paxillus ammoniavirescens]|nr:hypothetical protein BDN67DRAFT_250621 [Paxillus ammoniavirescens]